jgi:hypothetical protein
VDISPALARDLAILSNDLDGSDLDLETQLVAFAASVRLAIASYLGMRMTIAVHGCEFSFSAPDHAVARSPAIGTSLRIALNAVSTAEPGSTLVLYAASPGAFVDLAADLGYALGIDPLALVLDDQLAAPASGSGSGMGLERCATINKAVGVLIGRGHTPESARDGLARYASLDGRDPCVAAEQILRTVPARHRGRLSVARPARTPARRTATE